MLPPIFCDKNDTVGTPTMIVMKFGGTSVGSLARVLDAAAIIESQPPPRAVVVSAASGVTNLLLEAAQYAATGVVDEAGRIVEQISARHQTILAGISDQRERSAASELVDALHAGLRSDLVLVAGAGELSNRDSDRIVSIGERSM